MITENKILIKNAREALSGKWGTAVVAFLIYALISGALGAIPFAGALITMLIMGPLMLGWTRFSMLIARNEEASINQLFEGFNDFMRPFITYLLMVIFIILWMILLIIPGIIAAHAYSMTFYIMNDDPSIGGMDALRKSKEMMYGYKWKLFCLGLRFIGWALLCLLTFGIGYLWLVPWIQVSAAKFYDDIKDNPIEKKLQ
jgi:uncharacterized membrane protein